MIKVRDDHSGPGESEPHAQPLGSPAGRGSSHFDRVLPPDPLRPRTRKLRGKRALYSVDPEANPTPLLIVRCHHCEVERGLTLAESRRLLRPPWLVDPCRRRLWTRCPTCRRRTWLQVHLGPGIPWPFRPAAL
ncbi:MAG: hypothetical protein ABR592_09015 [Nitriliruptorales bacterium]